MSWFEDLFGNKDSVAHALLVIVLVAAVGVALGHVKIRGISLGIAWVLFVGLAAGHWGMGAKPEVLHFLREFGLILFVFTIGLQVGPGFFASLRKNGLPLNLAAAAIVLLGVALSIGQWAYFMGGSTDRLPAAVGLLTGGTTNTPSMAAGTAAFDDIRARHEEAATSVPVEARPDAGATIGAAYAVAYPIGIFGVLSAMLAIRFLFRINIAEEQRQLAAGEAHPTLDVLNLEVANPALVGKSISAIPTIGQNGAVVTRLLRDGEAHVAGPSQTLQLGDVLTAVGSTDALRDLELIIGKRTEVDARAVSGDINVSRVLVSHKAVVGKSIQELALVQKYGVQVTRVLRSGFELPVTPMTRLQYGDRVVVVGENQSMPAVIDALGDSPKSLDKPLLVPILVGIALGVILGSIPIAVPGLPAPLKLGLAGGPLIVAIVLSRIYRIGPLIWFIPNAANMMLREMGIVLFLACVGLLAGERFMATFRANGIEWLLMGAAITLVPTLLVGIIARAVFKMNYLTLTGLLAGSMTDPPALSFAQGITGSDAPTVSYATVYPLVMLLRVMSVQVMVLMLAGA